MQAIPDAVRSWLIARYLAGDRRPEKDGAGFYVEVHFAVLTDFLIEAGCDIPQTLGALAEVGWLASAEPIRRVAIYRTANGYQSKQFVLVAIRSAVLASPAIGGGEGGIPAVAEQPCKGRVTLAQAENAVRDWLARNASVDPSAVRRDAIAQAVGCSAGLVSKTAAWRAFAAERERHKVAAGREVPLTDGLLTVLADDSTAVESQDELAELIAQQEADERRDARQNRRRHKAR